MAILTYDLSDTETYDPLRQPTWTVFTAQADPFQFYMQDSVKTQAFYGTFTYPDSTHVKGTVTATSFGYSYPDQVFSVSGLKHDAAVVQDKVLRGAGLMEYLLSGNDTISGGWKAMGFAGNDLFQAHLQERNTTVDGGTGTDTLAVSHWLGVSINLLTGTATSLGDASVGSIRITNVENARGSTLGDVLTGHAGNNRLDGNTGTDTVSFAGVSTAITANLATGTATGQGTDTLVSIENLIGGHGADRLTGNAAANRLEGGAGADTLAGGSGNDTYVFDALDTFIEAAGAGTDTLLVTANHVLTAANIENLTLMGAAVSGTGNALANLITGNALANTLDGAAGSDTLVGGAGNDTYLLDATTDRVTEAAGAGTDTVRSSVSVTLAANVEYLVLTGTGAINGTGNSLANQITGNDAANVLSTGGGADTLRGGLGNDTYVVQDTGLTIYEASTGGVDTVKSAISYTLGSYLENLTLTGTAFEAIGNGLGNVLVGNAFDNRLDGGAGSDTLTGGGGNDTYLVDRSTDVITESANAGYDEVYAAISWTLSANVETLVLTGTSHINAIGNSLDNMLAGNAGNNRLDGGLGADLLQGSAGNDTYAVDNVYDRIQGETATSGTDTVETTLSWTLDLSLENLVATGTAGVTLTGNSAANKLTGNSGANWLEGLGGNDTLMGGTGNDHYRIESAQDVVVESANGGIDTVEMTGGSTYTMTAHVENLVGWGRITGNALANHITTTYGVDTLDGGAGADTLEGGMDEDIYYVDNAGDVIIDQYDLSTIHASVSFVAADNQFAHIILEGSAHLNATARYWGSTLDGNSGNNTLTCGYAGVLEGGLGDDTYIVGDYSTVVEGVGAGRDIVQTVDCSFSLAGNSAQIEEIRLDSGDHSATGNQWSNLLLGGIGDNQLDGGSGADTASFSNATAAVTVDLGVGTATGFGTDTLINIEAVIGSRFADTLRGGDGFDTLTGGAGADRFQFDNLAAADVLTDFVHGSDLLQIVQSGLAIGDADAVVDGAVTIASPGGHAAAAELVIASTALNGSITASAVAAAIGPASSAYELAQTSLFVVHNATDTAVYLFTSAGHDANISTGELTRLAWLSQQTALSTSDFGFIG